jgi:hypothetical protein
MSRPAHPPVRPREAPTTCRSRTRPRVGPRGAGTSGRTGSAAFLGTVALVDPVPPHAPDGSGLPGSAAIDQIISWTMYGGLVLLSLGVMCGFVMVGIGNISERPHVATRGKTAILYCLIGAVGIGVAIPLVNKFFSLG